MLKTEPNGGPLGAAHAPGSGIRLVRNFIDGEYLDGQRWFEKRSPLNNAVIAQVAEAGREEVDAAVRAARAALKGPWGTMTVPQRVVRHRRGSHSPRQR
ncbi:aldehyde dehydrogenase family protein [Paraburkholderia sp. A2WS-5]